MCLGPESPSLMGGVMEGMDASGCLIVKYERMNPRCPHTFAFAPSTMA